MTSEMTSDSRPVGEMLRDARVARGLSQQDMAGQLRLATSQIASIEASDWEALPGMTFVRGFVRNYARAVGLDADTLLVRLPGRSVERHVASLEPVSNAQGDMPYSADGRARNTVWPAAALAAVMFGVVVAGSYLDWFSPSPTATTPPVPAAAPVADAPAVVPVPVTPGPATPVSEAPSTAPTVPAAAPPVTAPVSAPATLPPPVTAVAPSAVAAPVPGPGQTRLHFEFGADSWVEVRDGSGGLLLSQLMRAGSQEDVIGTPPYTLVVGNASLAKVTHNGLPVDLTTLPGRTVARVTVK